MSLAGFTSNGLCFYIAENGFQEIPIDLSMQKDVLYDVSNGFLPLTSFQCEKVLQSTTKELK